MSQILGSTQAMAALGPRVFAVSSAFLQLGCGSTEVNTLTCRGGSELVFGYQELYAERSVTPGAAVTVENGVEYFFVDGSCRYWAFSINSVNGYWQDVISGTLTDQQLAKVNTELMQRDWGAISSTPRNDPPSSSDARVSIVRGWRGDDVGECYFPCSRTNPLSQVVDKARVLINALYETASPLPDHTAMRWLVLDVGVPSDDASNRIEWTGTTSLASFQLPTASDPAQADWEVRHYGGRARVPDADLELLRELRKEHIMSPDKTQLHLVEDGAAFWVYARQILPFEDENGLVRPPGWEPSQSW